MLLTENLVDSILWMVTVKFRFTHFQPMFHFYTSWVNEPAKLEAVIFTHWNRQQQGSYWFEGFNIPAIKFHVSFRQLIHKDHHENLPAFLTLSQTVELIVAWPFYTNSVCLMLLSEYVALKIYWKLGNMLPIKAI